MQNVDNLDYGPQYQRTSATEASPAVLAWFGER
jgi:hypothetical protein